MCLVQGFLFLFYEMFFTLVFISRNGKLAFGNQLLNFEGRFSIGIWQPQMHCTVRIIAAIGILLLLGYRSTNVSYQWKGEGNSDRDDAGWDSGGPSVCFLRGAQNLKLRH